MTHDEMRRAVMMTAGDWQRFDRAMDSLGRGGGDAYELVKEGARKKVLDWYRLEVSKLETEPSYLTDRITVLEIVYDWMTGHLPQEDL